VFYTCEIRKQILINNIKLSVNGNTLKDMGYSPSDKFRYALGKLFEMKLDGNIKNKDEEVYYAKKK